jgi:hypothetical protein
MRRQALAAVLLLGLAAGGCGSTGSSSADNGAEPAGTTTVAAPFSGGRATVSAPSQAPDTALLERIDVGRHDGYDRVVFRFRGDALPGYRVGFVKKPLLEDGSGAEISLAGRSVIGVRLEPASGFDLGQGEGTLVYKGPKRISGSQFGAEAITELARTGDFEAVLNWAIGLDRGRDFRVLELTDPARLVVDVQA